MTKITRVGVTFPPDLLKDFDDVIGKMGYLNRSKAVQDAVRLFVSEQKWLQSKRGTMAGVLILLYDHEARGLENTLTHVQHHYPHVICSTMHVHLSETECLEAISVKGSVEEIRKLSNELSSKKGLKALKTSIFDI
jgi:CopG family nickel-responsive transcriptional regulator